MYVYSKKMEKYYEIIRKIDSAVFWFCNKNKWLKRVYDKILPMTQKINAKIRKNISYRYCRKMAGKAGKRVFGIHTWVGIIHYEYLMLFKKFLPRVLPDKKSLPLCVERVLTNSLLRNFINAYSKINGLGVYFTHEHTIKHEFEKWIESYFYETPLNQEKNRLIISYIYFLRQSVDKNTLLEIEQIRRLLNDDDYLTELENDLATYLFKDLTENFCYYIQKNKLFFKK